MGKLQDDLRAMRPLSAYEGPISQLEADEAALEQAADALDAMEAALRELADTIPNDAPAYAIGPKAAAAHRNARAALAKLEGAE